MYLRNLAKRNAFTHDFPYMWKTQWFTNACSTNGWISIELYVMILCYILELRENLLEGTDRLWASLGDGSQRPYLSVLEDHNWARHDLNRTAGLVPFLKYSRAISFTWTVCMSILYTYTHTVVYIYIYV